MRRDEEGQVGRAGPHRAPPAPPYPDCPAEPCTTVGEVGKNRVCEEGRVEVGAETDRRPASPLL